MTDKNGIIQEIEQRLGSEGSRELAVALFPRLREYGYITFDAAMGYAFDPAKHLDTEIWNNLQADAEAAAEVLTLTDSEIEAAWDKGNDAGDGYAVGDSDMTPLEAAKAEDFVNVRTFNTRTSTSRCVVGHDGRNWVALCDANGPWAVTIEVKRLMGITPEQALVIIQTAFPSASSLHDDEEIEAYIYGPDDPEDYFAKFADEEELKADFQEFLGNVERG